MQKTFLINKKNEVRGFSKRSLRVKGSKAEASMTS